VSTRGGGGEHFFCRSLRSRKGSISARNAHFCWFLLQWER
jgi:hypothetical protein